jgi:hypothetical protein
MTVDDVKKAMADRTAAFGVRCLNFADDETKIIPLVTMDVCKSSVEQIFEELLENRFPIYAASCYEPRAIIDNSIPSLHAFGLAIDVNYLMNPYFNIISGRMIPQRLEDREEDRAAIEEELRKKPFLSPNEIEAVLKAATQEAGFDDRYINRNLVRPGMITQEQVAVFKKNGFDVYGGRWRQPMDFMHFQVLRNLAESLIKAPQDDARALWEKHLSECGN